MIEIPRDPSRPMLRIIAVLHLKSYISALPMQKQLA